jgi:hypothetical protein
MKQIKKLKLYASPSCKKNKLELRTIANRTTWYKIKMISSENLLERRSAYNLEKLLIKYQQNRDKTRKKGLKTDGR